MQGTRVRFSYSTPQARLRTKEVTRGTKTITHRSHGRTLTATKCRHSSVGLERRADNAEVASSNLAGGTKCFVGLLSRKPSTMDFGCIARSRIVMNTLQLHRNTTRNVERQISQISCTTVEMDGGTAPKGSSRFTCVIYGVVAQLGERLSCKQEVASSRLVFSTNRNFPLKAMMNRVQLPAIERLVRCVIVSKKSGRNSVGRMRGLGP